MIQSRRGCDINPLDVTRAEHRERLNAFVWADQRDRVQRISTAIDLAFQNPPTLQKSDAAPWIDEWLALPAEANVVRVLFHTISFQYLPNETQQHITDSLSAAGKKSSSDMPLAWLSMEQFKDWGPRLTLRLWPGGELRILATADAHARQVNWLG